MRLPKMHLAESSRARRTQLESSIQLRFAPFPCAHTHMVLTQVLLEGPVAKVVHLVKAPSRTVQSF